MCNVERERCECMRVYVLGGGGVLDGGEKRRGWSMWCAYVYNEDVFVCV